MQEYIINSNRAISPFDISSPAATVEKTPLNMPASFMKVRDHSNEQSPDKTQKSQNDQPKLSNSSTRNLYGKWYLNPKDFGP